MYEFVPETQERQSKNSKVNRKDRPQTVKKGKAKDKFHSTWNIEKLVVIGSGLQDLEYHAELLAAFKEDCELFLLEYATRECYTYKTFAKIWRTLQFGQILEGEENLEHLITFLENCFFQLKKYIIYSKNVFIQVGAVYMLYSIYFKQQRSDLVKIRWTLDEYTAVLKLLGQMRNRCNDFAFIFNKMRLSKAFLFVAETRRWGIEPRYAYEEKQLIDNIFGHDMSYSRVKTKIFSTDYYGTTYLEKVQNEYQERLAEYLNEHPEFQAASTFQPSTLVQDLKSICENFESKTVIKEEQVQETIFDKRQEIKNKAMKLENYSFRTRQIQNSCTKTM